MSSATTQAKRQRRIACIQIDSKHAQVGQNVDTVLRLATELIANKHSVPVDLVVLPELALTGYVFESKDEIAPLLEDPNSFATPQPLSAEPPSASSSSASAFISACRSSCASSDHPSLSLAAHLAQELQCHVIIGFAERCLSRAIAAHGTGKSVTAPFDARPTLAHTEPGASEDLAAFNSAALLAPDGALMHVFRKHFLFETDEIWAAQGGGFQTIHLPTLGTVCVAICMDLNPFKFTAPFEDYELASFCVERNVDLLVMPMAWLMPSDERNQLDAERSTSSSLATINYWALRCKPFFQPRLPPPQTPVSADGDRPGNLRYLITANRVGREAESTFGGSSCILQMQPGERPLLLEALGSSNEACLVATLPP